MRTILGAVVLCGGVGVVGWWGSQNNAVRMEDNVTAGAQDAIAGAIHPLQTSVGGRDITVSGIVDSDADRDAILATLNDVDGRRVVIDDLTVLPTASPYAFQSTLSGDAQSFSGNVPTDAQRAAFADRIGAAASGLTMASGMPDADWPGVVGQGLDSLDQLKTGTLVINDRSVAIEGLAALPQNREDALNMLAGLPDGYTLDENIVVEDDGTPMRITIRKDDQGATAVGKIPNDGDVAALGATLGQDLAADDVYQAQIGGPTADWNAFADTGVAALALLETGTLSISDTDLSLTGTAHRDGKDGAEALLADLSAPYGVRSEIDLIDDGMPLRLAMEKTADSGIASGKLPYGMSVQSVTDELGADLDATDLMTANIDADRPDFAAVALNGVRGLSNLNAGTLTLQDGALSLVGTATRSGKAAAETAVVALQSPDFEIATDITIADDGRPFALAVGTGTMAADPVGKLPFNMDAGLVNSVLGNDAPKDGLDIAEIESAGDQWPTAAGQALNALNALNNGALTMEGMTVTLTGDAGRAGRAAALASLAEIDPAFDVTSDIAILDDGAPFQLMATKTDDGQVASGKLPFGVSDAFVGAALDGTTDLSDVTIAEIEDSTGTWATTAGGGLAGLNALRTGQLDIVDQDVTLTGVATRAGRAAALAALDALPDGATATSDIRIFDDGAPFGLRVSSDGTDAVATGKLPFDLAASSLADLLDQAVDATAVQQAEIGGDADLNGAIEIGLGALSELDSGVLDAGPGQLSLTGVGSRAARDAALGALANVSDTIAVSSDIAITDDGAPFALNVLAGPDGAVADGKLPFGMSSETIASGLGSDVSIDAVRTAEIESNLGFPQTAQTGLAALAELQSGRLLVTETEIRLTGVGLVPEDEDRIRGLLAEAGEGVETSLDMTFQDDGAPPAWNVDYAVGGVPGVGGKLPAGLSGQDVVSALGFDTGTLVAQTGLTGTPDAAIDALTSLAPWIDRLDAFTVTAQGDDISINAVAGAEEQVDALSAAMGDAIRVPLSVVASPNAVALGTQRERADGRMEEFTATGWQLIEGAAEAAEPAVEATPEPLVVGSDAYFNFEPSPQACDARSKLLLENAKINFVTSGTDVDPSSADTIAILGRVVANCLEDPTLALEVGGHTDSSGGEDLNQRLSDARAASVVAELGKLGITSDRLTSVGYGELQPIADNETEEGRAINRRTEFTWSTVTASE